jgi:hypothetical protein
MHPAIFCGVIFCIAAPFSGISFCVNLDDEIAMTEKVISCQVADSIDVKGFCSAFRADLYYSDPAGIHTCIA